MANKIVIEVAKGQVTNSGVSFGVGDRLGYLEAAINELVELGIPVEPLYSILIQVSVHGTNLAIKLSSGADDANGES